MMRFCSCGFLPQPDQGRLYGVERVGEQGSGVGSRLMQFAPGGFFRVGRQGGMFEMLNPDDLQPSAVVADGQGCAETVNEADAGDKTQREHLLLPDLSLESRKQRAVAGVARQRTDNLFPRRGFCGVFFQEGRSDLGVVGRKRAQQMRRQVGQGGVGGDRGIEHGCLGEQIPCFVGQQGRVAWPEANQDNGSHRDKVVMS